MYVINASQTWLQGYIPYGSYIMIYYIEYHNSKPYLPPGQSPLMIIMESTAISSTASSPVITSRPTWCWGP